MKSLMAAVLVGVGLAAVCADGQTAAKRPMTFADLMAMKRVSDPQVSPSGRWVLFSVTDVSLEKNSKVNHLWVVPIGGGTERRIDAEWPSSSVTNGRFSPDGKTVSMTASDPGTGRTEIYLADWHESDGTLGAMRRLTDVVTDADGAIWSPDSKRLLFVSSVYPECSDKAAWAEEEACDKAKDEAAAASPVKAQLWTSLFYRHWDHYTGLKCSHVLVVSAGDGRDVRDLTPASVVGDAETPTFSLGGPLGYAWAPDSKEIAYVTNLDKVPAASTNNDVFTLKLDEPGAKAVKISTSPGSDDGPQYSPDGRWLAFRSQERAGYESDRFRLMVYDRYSHKTDEVMSKFDGWVDEFVWADNHSIFFASGVDGEEDVFSVDVKGDSVKLVASGGEYGSLAALPTTPGVMVESGVLATRMKVNAPNEVVLAGRGDRLTNLKDVGLARLGVKQAYGGQVTALTHVNDGVLSGLNLAALEQYRFTGAQGAKVQGFVVKPPNFDAKKKYPVKFLIHGGPQGAWGDAWSYRWNPELMAASGYVVVMVNPRGSTGYGQAFIDGVNGDWGGKAYEDLMKGLDYAEQHFTYIDKSRECALGASYGGYMANWILTHTDRFRCIVTHDGMFDPRGAYGSTEEMWFNEWEFRRAEDFPKNGSAGKPGQPWRYEGVGMDEDPFRKWSPMLYIQDAKTPTLVIHGQKDYRLDVSQGLELFTSLQRLGVPSEMLYFLDEGHWVLKPKNSELWNETVSDWCDRWTKSGKYAQ